jgi:general secretion pathway protein A
MYKKFYGLNRDPFEISPDPHFFVPTQRYNEALANLFYGVKLQKGLVVMTGEVGTGKTLLIRCLLELLRRQPHIAIAYVFNTVLTPVQFLQFVLGDFGVSPPANKSQLLLELNRFLIARHQRGLISALVVDEAQLLSWNLLEEIRLLTNLETAQKKLLQIILVGQPELESKLDSQELRQLKQRVGLRCRLEPLTFEEIRTYVTRRLQLAGASTEEQFLFPEATIASIYHYSRGIPRLINTICGNALITAFARQLNCVLPEVVAEVAADFRLNHLLVDSPTPGNGHNHPTETSAAGNGHNPDLQVFLRHFNRLIDLLERAQGDAPMTSEPVSTRSQTA